MEPKTSKTVNMPKQPNSKAAVARRAKAKRDREARAQGDEFFAQVDRDEFRYAIALKAESTQSERLKAFVQFLSTPAAARYSSMGYLCRKFQMPLKEIHEIWRDHNLHLGMIQSAVDARYAIMDTFKDARSRMEVCGRCDGLGEVTDEKVTEDGGGEAKIRLTRKCPECKGEGVVRVPGDTEARKLVFETMGLTKKGGPLVAQQFNFGSADGPEEAIFGVQKALGGG